MYTIRFPMLLFAESKLFVLLKSANGTMICICVVLLIFFINLKLYSRKKESRFAWKVENSYGNVQ